MKAVVYRSYGGPEVLKIEEIAKPVAKDDEILVRVHASTVTAGALLFRRGGHPTKKIMGFLIRLMAGYNGPKKEVLGYDVSGVVETVGKNVKNFKAGDEIYGTTTGLKQGAYAEYVCLKEEWKAGVVAHKPRALSFEEAAALPVGGMTALHFMKKASIKKGDKVLIYGASGSVGSYGVQIAKSFEAEVTGVSSGKNTDVVRTLGADKVMDYKSEAFKNIEETYDIVFDAVGKLSKEQIKKLTGAKGRYVSIKTPTSEVTEELIELGNIFEENEIKPLISHVFSLDEIQEDHRIGDTGHKLGNIVIKVK